MRNQLRATAAALAGVAAMCVAFADVVASDTPVSLHDLNAMDWHKVGTGGLYSKTVVGDSASFIIAALDSGFATRPHHHAFETVTYGVEGDLVNTVGGVPHVLAPDGASLAFSHVEHSTRNAGMTRGILIECPPVKRIDLLPPYPALDPPLLTTPDSRANPDGRPFFEDFRETSTVWTRKGANREATLTGDQIALRVLLVAPGSANAVNLRSDPRSTEQLAYLLSGTGQLTIAGNVTPVTSGVLIVMRAPSSQVLFQAMGDRPARILDCYPVANAPLRSN